MIYDNVKILVILNYLGLLQYYAQTKHYNVIIMVIWLYCNDHNSEPNTPELSITAW